MKILRNNFIYRIENFLNGSILGNTITAIQFDSSLHLLMGIKPPSSESVPLAFHSHFLGDNY